MANLGGFNPNEHEEEKSFDPIPAAQYVAMITDSDKRDTRDETLFMFNGEKVRAWYLKLTFEIIDGPYKGRLVWTNLNLVNKNPKAVEIANRNLASICRSVHHLTPLDDSQALHNKPLKIKVTIREAQNGYDASNEIKGYSPAADAPPQVAGAPANGGVTPPWANQEQKKDGNKPLPF
tara:strand:+ start:5648 stop:6181 length:534 start_codon:yes stop_codon:yes gene_type:complete